MLGNSFHITKLKRKKYYQFYQITAFQILLLVQNNTKREVSFFDSLSCKIAKHAIYMHAKNEILTAMIHYYIFMLQQIACLRNHQD